MLILVRYTSWLNVIPILLNEVHISSTCYVTKTSKVIQCIRFQKAINKYIILVLLGDVVVVVVAVVGPLDVLLPIVDVVVVFVEPVVVGMEFSLLPLVNVVGGVVLVFVEPIVVGMELPSGGVGFISSVVGFTSGCVVMGVVVVVRMELSSTVVNVLEGVVVLFVEPVVVVEGEDGHEWLISKRTHMIGKIYFMTECYSNFTE